ncbi:MAG: helix-turn-helix domain-containing protein [Myxococcaceae bacterium]
MGERLEELFGAHVKRLRKARELTQEELAERSDLSVDAVRRIERGGFSPSLETVGKLAQGLEVTLRTLFQSFERERSDLVSEVSDFLATRSRAELRLAWRVLQAMFDDR